MWGNSWFTPSDSDDDGLPWNLSEYGETTTGSAELAKLKKYYDELQLVQNKISRFDEQLKSLEERGEEIPLLENHLTATKEDVGRLQSQATRVYEVMALFFALFTIVSFDFQLLSNFCFFEALILVLVLNAGLYLFFWSFVKLLRLENESSKAGDVARGNMVPILMLLAAFVLTIAYLAVPNAFASICVVETGAEDRLLIDNHVNVEGSSDIQVPVSNDVESQPSANLVD